MTLNNEENQNAPERVEPINAEAEQQVLGILLYDHQYLERVSQTLRPEHFAYPEHQVIYSAILAMAEHGEIADPVTLKAYLDNSGELSTLGSSTAVTPAAYLAGLLAGIVSVSNIRGYAKVVREAYQRRELIRIASQLTADAYDARLDANPGDLIRKAETGLYDLAEREQSGSRIVTAGEAARLQVVETEHAMKNGEPANILRTRLVDLDRALGGGIGPGEFMVLAARPSMGKAQPLDAMVLTMTGWRRMGDIAVGDQLASVDGLPSEVKAVFPQGDLDTFKVKFSDGREAEACADHLWSVHYRGWRAPRVLPTYEVRRLIGLRRYQGRLWIERFGGDYNNQQPLPIDPYLLGLILGDGGVTGNGVRFSTISEHILARIRDLIPPSTQLVHRGRCDYQIVNRAPDVCGHCSEPIIDGKSGQRWCSYVCSMRGQTIEAASKRRRRRAGENVASQRGSTKNELTAALEALGVMGAGAIDKRVPACYLDAPRANRTALLRGLMDTDGSVEKHGSVRFYSSSRQLADDVVYLVRSLGGWAKIAPKQTSFMHNGEKRIGQPSWVVTICLDDLGEIVSVPEKVARVAAALRSKRLTFEAITPSRRVACQCIAVSHPSRLYVTDDFVVTHNTALAQEIAERVAHQGIPVAFISLEMRAQALMARRLAAYTGINTVRQRMGNPISLADVGSLIAARDWLDQLPIFIDDKPGRTAVEICLAARHLIKRHSIGLVIVDHMQIIRQNAKLIGNATEDMTQTSGALHTLAGDTGVPVLALSQLSRGVEGRDDKRPDLADLRQSGSIEQDADIVAFLYREEYYLRRAEPKRRAGETNEALDARTAAWNEAVTKCTGRADVLIRKHRTARCPVDVSLAFDGERQRFQNWIDHSNPHHHHQDDRQ